jgi:ParB family transcriptional regulator, chromosome partitioning protein
MPEAVPDEILHVPLDEIDIFSGQSHEYFDDGELSQFADNIKINGLLQPGIVWHDPGRNRLVLVAGERRYRALKRAGIATMAVKVLRGPSTQGELLRINPTEKI